MMDEEEKEVNRKTWWVMGIILLILLMGIAGYYIWFQQQQMKEMEELFALEKESLLDDFEEISLQYDEFKISINNDSLFFALITEKEKVQRLQEELRTIKSTNARRINELKQEVETLRKISQSFVVQIDSLNSLNERLKNENKQVTQQYQQSNSKVAILTKDNERLSEQVQMASRFDAGNIQLKPINARGRDARIDRATQLKLTFIIAKNISAPIGEQAIYVRIMRPNDEILRKKNTGTFQFENRDIPYSIMKPIEYDGEEQPVELYWDVEETLSAGNYIVVIFAAGNQIGRKTFPL